ncbi:MAG: endolytic transglycosylase MltG [Hyphomicrobiaceae bacterium]|nr:endolytic transglycosylase MltG [Hyphomicrobiaceae bacterium]
MSSYGPAEPPRYNPRATGALARSPSEQLEPTRPLARSRSRRLHSRNDGDEPGRSSALFRVVSGIFTLLLLVMAIGGALALVLQNWVNVPGPLAASKALVIPKGEGVHDIAARLEREGIITDRRLFMAAYLIAKATRWGDGTRPLQLKAGDYEIPKAASIRSVIDIIGEGKTIAHRVTIPEGLTSYQIVERLKADPDLAGEIAQVPEEGSLLPETFSVQHATQRQTIIDKMQAGSRKQMEKLWAQRQKGLPFKTWEEAVVLASIIEKETGRNDERERVAAVFINRLRQNMPLQSDPTILYGINGGKTEWGRKILQSEIDQKTAHNTYQIRGLPPTPICNPGRAAIEAVLNPASTKEIFFVADGKGGHIFAETLKDHNVNVQKYRALEREKEKDAKAKAAASGATVATGPALPDKKADKSAASEKIVPEKAAPERPATEKPAAEKAVQDKSKNAGPPQPSKAAETPVPAKVASEKASLDKNKNAAPGEPDKAADKTTDRSKGAATPTGTRRRAANEDGAWSSTTEPTEPKAKH